MLSEFLDTSDAWITSRTGIATRHVLSDESLTDIGAAACRAAVEASGLSVKDMDMLICATVQGDTITPALACTIQGAIGASCPSLDINAACSGFIFALDMADAYIAAGKARHILVVAAEATTHLPDWRDRSTCVLFGDGAGAAVVGAGDGVLAQRLTTEYSDVLYAPAHPGNSPYHKAEPYSGMRMAGQDVYKFAVSHSISDIYAVTEAAGMTPDGIDHYFIHQANRRIIEAVRQRLNQPEAKFHSCIERTGNFSSATIPYMLDEAVRAGRVLPGETILFSAFGAGLTTGAMIIRW